jgi:hypothetical protein
MRREKRFKNKRFEITPFKIYYCVNEYSAVIQISVLSMCVTPKAE